MTRPPVPAEEYEQLVDFIAEFTDLQGFPPTIREIAERMGYGSYGTAQNRLLHLRYLGRVDWRDGCSRTLRVLP